MSNDTTTKQDTLACSQRYKNLMAKNELTLGIAGAAFMLRRVIKLQVAAQHVAFPLEGQLSRIMALDNALTEALRTLSPELTQETYLECAKVGLEFAAQDESTDL
jgi:hypothetical protein